MSDYTMRVGDHDATPILSLSLAEHGFAVARSVDELSPYLAQYAADGVALAVVVEGASQTFRIDNAYIASYQIGAAGYDTEEISFDGEVAFALS